MDGPVRLAGKATQPPRPVTHSPRKALRDGWRCSRAPSQPLDLGRPTCLEGQPCLVPHCHPREAPTQGPTHGWAVLRHSTPLRARRHAGRTRQAIGTWQSHPPNSGCGCCATNCRLTMKARPWGVPSARMRHGTPPKAGRKRPRKSQSVIELAETSMQMTELCVSCCVKSLPTAAQRQPHDSIHPQQSGQPPGRQCAPQ